MHTLSSHMMQHSFLNSDGASYRTVGTFFISSPLPLKQPESATVLSDCPWAADPVNHSNIVGYESHRFSTRVNCVGLSINLKVLSHRKHQGECAACFWQCFQARLFFSFVHESNSYGLYSSVLFSPAWLEIKEDKLTNARGCLSNLVFSCPL